MFTRPSGAFFKYKKAGLPDGHYAHIRYHQQKDAPDIIRIFPGYQTDLGNFEAGSYRLYYLLMDGRYLYSC
ncbi:hypothetical protein HK413_01665 [Mucilaginibacter sp. S1162]|uniref:Uncharacterized protein n=1 Tax=Mucilaginibacter humi TaxID=2732510 RepID=A0ABX1VZ15_9SPHI|nr:hypothetical protein [Mucilaginibacter humi]NNU33206.1 hypothetical protein [Mucilaginibacter humi]